MRAVVIGAGALGSRAARQLASTDGVDHLLIVDAVAERAADVARSLGDVASGSSSVSPGDMAEADVVLLAVPIDNRRYAESALEQGAHVVAAVDDLEQVRDLLSLDAEARERALSVVVGAGFSPGLTCVLARHGAADFDSIQQVHVAKTGTGGPACARQHHRALKGEAIDWRDGGWARRRSGSGRELCYFPDPVGGEDCYRATLPDAVLLAPAFAGIERVTARVGATRRDRFTAWLPMLRPPHPEGVIGGVRVEVRGRRGPTEDVRILGAIDRPAVAGGAVAAVSAAWAADGRMRRHGAGGLADLIDEPAPFLRELARRGVKAAVFEGAAGIGVPV